MCDEETRAEHPDGMVDCWQSGCCKPAFADEGCCNWCGDPFCEDHLDANDECEECRNTPVDKRMVSCRGCCELTPSDRERWNDVVCVHCHCNVESGERPEYV